MLKIKRRGEFSALQDELCLENSDLEQIIDQRVKWFRRNPQDTRLANHSLTGKMEGKWAFSITDDIRIVYKWLGKTTVRFLVIGGHKRAYRRKSI